MQLISPARANGSGQVSPIPSIADGVGSSEKRLAFRVEWASTVQDVREAQRLRYQVFVDEMGAVLQAEERSLSGHDVDSLDDFCEHLIARADGGLHDGEVIATCRVLSPLGALRAGHRYTDLEFDLAPIDDLLSHSLEMGRVCVHREWRNGLLVMGLWREIGRRMSLEQLDTLMGCCSVTLEPDGAVARRLWHDLQHDHLAPPHRRVVARHPLDIGSCEPGSPAPVPALFNAYLRCGGKLLGPPAIDRLFNTADFPMYMCLSDLPTRYRTRIFGLSS